MKKIVLFVAAALTCMAAGAQTLFNEDFESVTLTNGVGSLPDGWIIYEDDGENFHSSQADYRTFGNGWCVYNMNWQGQCAFCMTYTMDADTPVDRWMVTPQIEITEEGYSLLFDVYASQYYEKLTVLLSTTGNAKADFTTTLLAEEVLDAGEQTKFFDLSDYAGESVYIAFRATTDDGLYTLVDNVAIKKIAANSISMVGVSAANYAAVGQTFDMDVTVYNEGSAPLTSFTLAYTVGSAAEQTVNVTGINVAPFTSYTYTVQGVAGIAEGACTVSVTVSEPNGVADLNDADNSASCNVTGYDPANAVQRTSVLEHFTTAVCPNCPSGHERLEQAIQGREDRVVWVAHHSGYYTDGMTISESQTALKYFNDGGSTYAPACMIDRDHANATEEDNGPVFFPNVDIRDVMTNALSMPAFVSCEISNVNYNEQTRELSVTVSGQFTSTLAFDSPRVHLFLMEDSIIAAQSGASGNYQHNHVLRACISGLDGVSEGFTTTNAGDTYSKTFTYTLPTEFRANKCWLGAFVSNQSSDVNNCRIMNGAKTGRLINHADPTTTGITAVEASVRVNTYPNPATDMAVVSAESTIRSYSVVDAMGRVVMSAENVNADVLELNVSTLSQGMYFVTVRTDKGVATERFSVVR